MRSPLRWELALLTASTVCWLLVFVTGVGWVSWAGTLDLGLYPLYSLAAALGWVAGNVFVNRSRTEIGQRLRRRLLFSYYIGPPSLLFLLRALAPSLAQQAAPLVPIYSLGVYTLFFLVPLTLRAGRPADTEIRNR